jgi:pimeloyl-ACP methyl ester carboxylesterase
MEPSMNTQTIAVGEFSFTVDMAGPEDGTPVLLLHGFPETRRMWTPLVEALGAAGYRAIAPDQRGYSAGARPAATEAYATEHLLADALGLMDALGCPRFHLVGHDWGGQLSWLLAAHHPGRLISLSVASRPHPAAFVRAMREDAAQAERSGHHRSFQDADAVTRMRSAGLRPLRQALENQAVPPASVEDYIATLLQPGGIEGAMSWYRAGAGSGLQVADTPSISVPTLYIWGRNDATVGQRAAELTAEYVTGPYRFVPIDEGSHFVVDQFPGMVTDLIFDFIAGQKAL